MKYQLYMVSLGNIRFVTWASNTEHAKQQGHSWIGGNSDQYVVIQLSQSGDRVHLNITLSI